jgi:hypothetical protein
MYGKDTNKSNLQNCIHEENTSSLMLATIQFQIIYLPISSL